MRALDIRAHLQLFPVIGQQHVYVPRRRRKRGRVRQDRIIDSTRSVPCWAQQGTFVTIAWGTVGRLRQPEHVASMICAAGSRRLFVSLSDIMLLEVKRAQHIAGKIFVRVQPSG